MRLRWLAIALLGVFLLSTFVISQDETLYSEPWAGHELTYPEPDISISPVNNLCPSDSVTLTYNNVGKVDCGNGLLSDTVTTLRLPNDDSNKGKVGVYNSGGTFVTAVGFGKEPSIYCGNWQDGWGANRCAYAVGGSCSRSFSAPSSTGTYYVKFDWNVRGEADQCLEWRFKQLPQSFTVVGKSSSLSTSKATYFPGESVTATTSTNCACTRNSFTVKILKQDGTLVSSMGSGVHASSDSTAYGDTFYGTAPSAAGTYNVMLDSPDNGCDRYTTINVCANSKSITPNKNNFNPGEYISASTLVSCGCAASSFSVRIVDKNGNLQSTLVRSSDSATAVSYSSPSPVTSYTDLFTGNVPNARGQYLVKLDSTNDDCDATSAVNVDTPKVTEACSPNSNVCSSSADCCSGNICDSNALGGFYKSVIVRAKGSYYPGYSGSVMPVVEVWIRESSSQSWVRRNTFTTTGSYADYTTQWLLGSEPLIRDGSEVAVVYTNPDEDNGRELNVDYIKVNDYATFQSENVRVRYHIGDFKSNADVRPGQEYMTKGGGLRFPIGNGVCIQCSGSRQGNPGNAFGGYQCEASCGASAACDEQSGGYSTGSQCCKSDCTSSTLDMNACSREQGLVANGNCYYGSLVVSCNLNSGWTCGASNAASCSSGTAACNDNGVVVSGRCYYGESCSAYSYTAPGSAVVDDGNSCTVDVCSSSGVSHVTKILDGLSSTQASDCCSGLRDNTNGVCIRCNSNSVQTSPSNVYGGNLCDSSCGADIRCDEKAAGAASGNSCCTTSCNYLDITGSCPSPKTVSGVCYYNPNPSCTSTVNCNYQTASIDDGNACTVDACTGSGVTHTALAAAGQACTQNSQCCSGTCDTSSGVCVTCDANKKQTSPTPSYGGGLCEASCGAAGTCDEKDTKPPSQTSCCYPDCSAISNCVGGCYYTSTTDNGCSACSFELSCRQAQNPVTRQGCSWCVQRTVEPDGGNVPSTASSCTAYTSGTTTGACQGTACISSTVTDTCLTSTSLREYYSSGISSCTSTDINCKNSETTYCGSGANAGKIMRNEWQCSSGACNDGAADSLVDDCGAKSGWYCNGNTKEYRQYTCGVVSGSAACTYAASQPEDCLGKASTDSDSGNYPFAYGSCNDYYGCGGTPGSADCVAWASSDYCMDGRYLGEMLANGVYCSGTVADCYSYGQSCVDSDGGSVFNSAGKVSGSDSTGCSQGKCSSSGYEIRDSCGGPSGNFVTEYGCPSNPSGQDSPYVSQTSDCESQESTYCSGRNIMRNEWRCSSGAEGGYCNDGAQDSLVQNCGLQSGWYCTPTGARELRDYTCSSASGSPACAYTVTQTDDCPKLASQDSDLGDRPDVSGYCRDFTQCAGSGPNAYCDLRDYNDNCVSNTDLAETYASGVSCPSKNYNCNTYAQSCSDLDGSPSNYNSAGSVSGYDGTSCSGSRCIGSSYAFTDRCSGNSLTEYGCGSNQDSIPWVSNSYNCENSEYNYCGSGGNAGKIMRNEWQCTNGGSGGYCNDAASDSMIQDCNLLTGWYCSNAGVRVYRSYACIPSGSPYCDYTITQTEDCTAKASEDSDGGYTPFTSGLCKDYYACQGVPGSAFCAFNNLNDVCTGNNLKETYAQGAACPDGTANCLTYGQTCSDPDGIAGVTTPRTTTGRDSTGCAGGRCTQLDFGKQDKCTVNALTEYGCPANADAQDVPFISQDYDCLTYGQTCLDSDSASPDVFKLSGTVSGTDAQGCLSGAGGGYCNLQSYSQADACASQYSLTEYACNPNPVAQDSPFTSSSKECRDYDTVATGDSDDSPSTTGVCFNGDKGSCGTGQCNVDVSHVASAEGCSGTCGTGVDSCTYSEYYAANSNGAGAAENCVLKTYDADDATAANHNPCTTCGKTWIGSGQGWLDSQGLPVGSQPGEYAGYQSTGCCGDDKDEVRKYKSGMGDLLTDVACCTTDKSCVLSGKCYQDIDTYASANGVQRKDVISRPDKDRVYADANGDGFLEVCDANTHPALWVTPTGSVVGKVTDAGGNPLGGVEVKIVGSRNRTFTAADGTYRIDGVNASRGTILYDMIASKAPFSPSTLKGIQIKDFDTVAPTMVNFALGFGSSLCEEDCSYTNDEMCHSECQGTNGCLFFDRAAIDACDGFHKDFTRPYNFTETGERHYEVRCCEGKPKEPVRIKATIKINSTAVARITRTVYYEGKLVKMIIDVFE
ncbi:carboxypeptidase regulatory-like domain-containing protein [Candidatus Woesearchaeota archaeon]|nr:carboxypeptidase regulatory-like domain-containing protein [Candidatus Woesearchaeota archaeon]